MRLPPRAQWWLMTMACWAVVLAQAVIVACARRWGWCAGFAGAAAVSALTAWAVAPWRASRLRESTRLAILMPPTFAGLALIVASGTAPAYRWSQVVTGAALAALMLAIARRRENAAIAAPQR